MLMVIVQHILTGLELSTFQKKMINSYEINILKQIFTEYKQTIQ